jgi:hypothetical protein
MIFELNLILLSIILFHTRINEFQVPGESSAVLGLVYDCWYLLARQGHQNLAIPAWPANLHPPRSINWLQWRS